MPAMQKDVSALTAISRGQLDVMTGVFIELKAQYVKWDVQNHDDWTWFLILIEEMGEAAGAAIDAAAERGEFAREVVYRMRDLGRDAKYALEGDKPDRVNPGTRHDVNHELTQVAAVAVSFIENRNRTARQ